MRWVSFAFLYASISLYSAAPAFALEDLTFGGVEIGSNGVKVVTVKFDPKAIWNWAYDDKKFARTLPADATDDDRKKASQLGLAASNFAPDVIDEIVLAVDDAIQKEFQNIPESRRFVVISSGVVSQAKDKEKTEELQQLKEKIFERSKIQPDEISVQDEIRFTLEELLKIEGEKPGIVLAVDIGGGNTKFGAFSDGSRDSNQFRSGHIDIGTGNSELAKQLEPWNDATPEQREDLIASVAKGLAEKLSVEKIAAFEQNSQPKIIYFLGGSVYSLIGFTQPAEIVSKTSDAARPLYAEILPHSFQRYHEWVINNSQASPELSDKLTAYQKEMAESLFNDSTAKVPVKLHPAVLALIQAVNQTFHLNAAGPGFSVRFPNDGHFAWTRGYVRNKAINGDLELAWLIKTAEQSQRHAQEITALKTEIELLRKEGGGGGVNFEKLRLKVEKVGDQVDSAKTELNNLTKKIGTAENENDTLHSSMVALKQSLKALDEKVSKIKSFEKPKSSGVEPPAEDAVVEPNPTAGRQAFQRGRDAYDHHQVEQALAFFEEAIRHDPNETLYWYFRALAEVRLNRTKEAQASAQRIAELLKSGRLYSYQDLCRSLERVQGPDRMLVEHYLSNGLVSLEKSPKMRSLTE